MSETIKMMCSKRIADSTIYVWKNINPSRMASWLSCVAFLFLDESLTSYNEQLKFACEQASKGSQ